MKTQAATGNRPLESRIQSGMVGESSPEIEVTLPTMARPRFSPRGRRWMYVGAVAALVYAFATLIAASLTPNLGFLSYHGSPIVGLAPGSAAAAAGLQAGDLIIEVNGVATAGVQARMAALAAIAPGDQLSLVVARGADTVTASYTVGRTLPLGSAAGILLATLLLCIAFLADRGAGSLPRSFFRSTLVYVVFLAGAFSAETVLTWSMLAIPWLFALVLVAPVTCHFMLKFPAGRLRFSRLELGALYGPPLLLGVAFAAKETSFALGYSPGEPGDMGLAGGLFVLGMSTIYLLVGAVARSRRLRRKRDEIDPVAARWLHLGHVIIVVPLLAGTLWALRDVAAFVAGGFRPFVAVAMVGGSICVVLAMTRTPFGELDRMWRRSSGYFLTTALAAGLYLVCIGLLGGTASVLSGGDFRAALAATLAAAVVFGPLRLRLQRMVDERFARDRSRARGLLREASEAAAATLDVDSLQTGAAHRVRAALSAEGAAIFVADEEAQGGWRRVTLAGSVPIGRRLRPGDPLSRRLDAALTARAPRELCAGIVAIPLPVDERAPEALVVAPAEGQRLDDEEKELLMTLAAGLVVAIGNARAHRSLQELTLELSQKIDVAEERRREIVRLKERLEEENRELVGQLASRSGRAPVIGRGLRGTFELVHKVARSEASVLVRGETGVGKELVARALHAASARRDGPFIVVDCGAIAPGVFESALFGHEKGAFTGAVRAAQGAFRAASGGTIFLDEIGELPLELQPKLLRVLQEREVHPVGAERTVPVDVRVLAGTNRDLAAEVDGGAFRQDLLYRLQVVEIEIPPLRQRSGDIPALADHFLALCAERAGHRPKHLAPDALAALLEHEWPGNVRELEHALEAAAVYAEGDEIRAADLPIFEQLFKKKGKRAISDSGIRVTEDGAPKTGLRETLEQLEQHRLADALREHGNNKTRTARALGMSRGALLRRLKRYEIQA